MPDHIAERFALAQTVAREAGDLTRRLFLARTPGTYTMKGHQDYLTEADAEVERLIAGRVAQKFPDDTFFGEEGGGQFSDRTWVVDPIDGTANFARGVPRFCISIAFLDAGEKAIGIIVDPMIGETFAAVRGGGARLNGTPIRVSNATEMRASTIELGWSMRRGISEYVAMVDQVMATGAGIMRAGSGALGLAYVAAGRQDGYAELHINAWDCLAGLLLVEEAGGWTNNFLANEGLRRGNPLLACAAGIADQLRAATGISD